MQQLSPPKPFRTYPDLVALLIERGMGIANPARSERKLAQVGYYRLSGYWFPARDFVRDNLQNVVLCDVTQKPLRQNSFLPDTTFDDAFSLYLFDKKLRQLMLDAIERIEIHVRTVTAHEVGYYGALAYTDPSFIVPKQTQNWTDRSKRQRNTWLEWLERQNGLVARSQEDCIEWHKRNRKAIPFWVAIEAWDFGTLSKYYEILKGNHQNRIAQRLGVSNTRTLKLWLQEINTLRNRCAHHSRIWNQVSANALPDLPAEPYFQTLKLDHSALTRLYGQIAIIWFLVQRIGPSSDWIRHVAYVIDSKPNLPGCPFGSLGLPSEDGFPRHLFGI
ncbi:Abi family protein [Klebsiella quasipneumoniae]|nr:Abi family protein [Klebsiella quasipneumoniae]